MGKILEIKGLRKTYDNFQLQDISFSLDEGFIMGFIGPNGAGKSTTVKLIMNLLKKETGEIKVFGLDNILYEQEIKEEIGFVYADNYYYEELTVSELKSFLGSYYKKWSDKAFDKYANRFNLPKSKKIKELSKGMKMKLSLALAFSHNPRLLIMDEPTSGLDPVNRNELLDILTEIIQDEKKGVLFSTHITSDLEKVADYITFINEGEIMFSESHDKLLEDYSIVKGKKELLDLDIKKEFIGLEMNKFGFKGLVKADSLLRKWENQLLWEKPTLEEIMILTVRGEKHA